MPVEPGVDRSRNQRYGSRDQSARRKQRDGDLGMSCQLEPGRNGPHQAASIRLIRETVVRTFGGGSDEMMRSVHRDP